MTIPAERAISFIFVFGGIQIGNGEDVCISDISPLAKLTIPDSYNGKNIISIGTNAFGKSYEDCVDIDEIILPNNLLYVAEKGFMNAKIRNIVFPQSIIEIGATAFYRSKVKNISFEKCSNSIFSPRGFQFEFTYFPNLTLPKNMIEIPKGFLWGSSITEFHIERTIKKINIDAFCYTLNLEKITCDSPYYVVHNGILYSTDYRTLLKYPCNGNIEILPTVTEFSSIGSFSGANFTKFVLKNKIRKFAHSSFGYCFSMVSCDLSCAVATEIPNSMFYMCSSLETIVFPKSIYTMSYDVFINCASLKSLILPVKLTYIDQKFGINTIKDIYYCGINNVNTSVEGIPNIHVTQYYPHSSFLNKPIKDKSLICSNTAATFFYDPREIICTLREVCYSKYLHITYLTAFILIYDENHS